MSAIHRAKVDQVMEQTGCGFELAEEELIAADWDAELAIVNVLNG